MRSSAAAMRFASDFDPNDSYDEDSPSHLLGQILRDGPEVGVFVLVWFDRPAGVAKRLDNQQLSEFGQRLVTQMGRDDSSMTWKRKIPITFGWQKAIWNACR